MERARRTHALALLPELLENQWRPYPQLRARQLTDLREHLISCGERIPYYRRLFAERGFDPAAVTAAEDLAGLPLLDKAAIKAAGADLLAADADARGARAKQTSGSTGEPLNYYLDTRSHSYLWAHIWRAWSLTGYQPGDPYATLSGGSLLPEKVDLKQRLYLWLSACVHLPSYHLSDEVMDRYARLLATRKVAFLYGYPSSLELFAAHLLREGRRLAAMRAVFTTSELLAPEARSTIERGIGCRVHDLYGCNDGGLHSFECEQHQGLHLGMESCLVEVVDDEGRPLPEGETGRIVTTHLANRTHPFLRYVTGDVGALSSEPCACGRGLARILSIAGRERDFIVTPAGRKVHGAFFNHFEPFYRAAWLSRFQVHQPERDRLELRVVVERSPTAQEREQLIAELVRGLGPMRISIEEVDELALTATGKFRVVTSALDPAERPETP